MSKRAPKRALARSDKLLPRQTERSGQDIAAGLRRDFECVQRETDHRVEAGTGDGLDDAVAAERGFGAAEGCRAHFLAREQLGHEVIDNPLVVAAEFRPPPRSNGLDRLAA